ncbi:MAG TPA: acyl-CoA dehydrogenase family protein [Candidatus Margulisiibacteriota bacterium]|nr:acyl-CoA dehydrogenase family protein [Candidatus Margulisiibacteriota bacterium]
MHLTPTDEQQALKDAVRRFCEEQVTPERLATWEKEPRGIDDACWHRIAELGWFGLGVPVAAGGSGLGLVEVACVLEECARGLIPRRVINAICGAYALGQLAPQQRVLPAVARGEQTVALAFNEQHVRDPRAYATEIDQQGGVTVLNGEKWYVADAAHADWHLVAARDKGTAALVLVPADHAQVSALRTFDGERQAVVRYVGVPAAERFGVRIDRVRPQQTALALAEMVGGMDAVLAMTVAYVKEREQFGQKIAVFQAVQHQVADMATAFTAGRHLAWQAITRVAAATEEGGELEAAAVFVGQAFKRLTLSAHHLHGGAGYVVEHPLHYHAERAQALCIRHAPEAPALALIAAHLLE